jgi:S-adenosylmethionine:tRNA ribosyltransferase-isomerase
MNLDDFDFKLPAESIAQWPLAERDASRMLLLDRATGVWQDRQFRELPALLRGDELVVLNDVRVLPARLFGHRAGLRAETRGANHPTRAEFLTSPIEVLLVRKLATDTWEALVRPGRKIPVGERILFGDGELEGRVEARGEFGLRVLRFSSKNGSHETLNLYDALNRLGHIPLPPYIKRADEPLDRERYQTVYAQQGSAVAAPTAGLHFTPGILESLRERGVEIANVTLEVGLGTFEPVRTENLEEHKIHVESYEIPERTAEAVARAKRENRPVLAVGTTVVRAFEDAAEKTSESGRLISSGKFNASIFLLPGKPFRVVDQLLTNFHLPRSSLLALVAAFAGLGHTLTAYRHAVDSGYRFYSYGDCMLIR